MNELFLQPSVIELNKSALQNNIRFLKERANNSVKLSSVIKGNAYGHGISYFLPMAEECGMNHFSVFSADEALLAHRKKIRSDTDIMIMGMIRDAELEWAIEHDIEFYLFELDRLGSAIKTAKKMEKKARVHLQIETGMNRTGFEEPKWKHVFESIKQHPEEIKLEGICTHYAGAESMANYYRIENQDKQLKKALNLAREILGKLPLIHASSSAAYLTQPHMHYDMARVGIAHYGFWPSRETYIHNMKNLDMKQGEDPLKRVLTWKSEIMNTKWIDSGDFIGYGNVYLAGKKMKIATVPIGYSHGFGRNLTNAGYVLIKGTRAGVVGLVNMNMITINVTHIEDTKKGDEVVLIGRQGDDEITVASFGEMTNNLNYEVLTRLPTTIPRVIKNG
ncbi:MAG: alanine racemase [Balneolaceae bacterium]|nr:alanine racemase [Balneolaceae bacterium]